MDYGNKISHFLEGKRKTYAWNVMDFINGGSLGLQSGMKTCSPGLPMKSHSLPLADSVGDYGSPYFPVYVFPVLAGV